MQNVYLDVVIVAGIIGFGIILLWFFLSKTMKEGPGPDKPPNIYDYSYAPGMVGSSKGPFPMGSRKREKDRR